MWHCVLNKIFWVVCLWLLCFDFWAEIAYGKDKLRLHKIQHYSHFRFYLSAHVFVSPSRNLQIAVDLFIEQNPHIKLRIQNTEVTSYKHRIQNISTRNTMSHIGFRYTYCVLCADVLSSVFITCDFCVLTYEFHVFSFPFCVLCYMFWGLLFSL